MSPRHLIIVLSVVANVVLGAVWWQRSSSAPVVSVETNEFALTPSTTTTALAVSGQEVWAELTAGDDDADFVARLRRDGFPPHVIRELVRFRLQEKYAARFRELSAGDQAIPYWRNRFSTREIDFENRAKLRALNREMNDELKGLLGADALRLPGDPGHENRARMYGSIPPDKIAGIEAINADYRDLTSQIREAARGITFPEDREKLAYLEREQRADLAQLLTPGELEEYDRRNSPTANSLRNQLRFFAPNEEEFVAMYNAQREFDERYGVSNLSGEQADRRRDARPELFAKMEAALGPQRFEDYRLMTDGNYGGTHSMVTSIGLSAETAKDLLRIQQDVNRRAEAMGSGGAIPPDQQAAQLEVLAREAREKVTGIVGADHVKAYEQRAGQWLTRLTPTRTPAAR